MTTRVMDKEVQVAGMTADINRKWNGLYVTVVGLRRSGLALARLLHGAGATVFVTDHGQPSEYQAEARELDRLGVQYELGGHTERSLTSAELMVLSPGVPLTIDILTKARARDIPIEGELETAFGFCTAPVLAVTGANGKTTTTEWIGSIYRGAHREAEVGGNIGRPFSDFTAHLTETGRAILEVSSFQLETINRFRPRVGVILNITADHLDRHGDLDTYRRMKFRLFENQQPSDCAIVNADDLLSNENKVPGQGRTAHFSLSRPVQYGAWSDGKTIIRKSEGPSERVAQLSELPIPGLHNVANACAAIAVASADRLTVDEIRPGLLSFKGVPHRLEPIATIAGVLYVNDSKATNPDSVAKALASFDRPLVLIMGGLDKGTDFRPLRDDIRRHVRTLVLTGQAIDKLETEIGDIVPTHRERDFREAVSVARHAASTGDVVLLSPGCASFDQFKNYEHRGEAFRALVEGFNR